MSKINEGVRELLDLCKDHIDLTNSADQDRLYDISNQMTTLDADVLEHAAFANHTPLEFRAAYKLYLSKKWVSTLIEPVKIGIVFAMWGEQNRLLPKSQVNPNGEDLMNTKIRQLKWLFDGTCVDWHLYAIDDGCPYNSGRIALEQIKENPDHKKVSVLFLSENLPAEKGPLKNLLSADDSRKGGAMILGSMKALDDGSDAVIYTDADNSVHLGQLGILLHPYINENVEVVLGNRKDDHSVLVKQENRWGIGIKVLRHMQRMIGHSIFSKGILDSQAAFKLYSREIMEKILENPSVYDFSFDSDWIACTISNEIEFAKVPFAFIDSFAESASIVQGPMTTWETLLKGLAVSVKQRGLKFNEEMANVLERQFKTSKDLDMIIDSLPEQLENAKDHELGNPDIMSPNEIEDWVILIKSQV
jgi:glycosyltransferase involved in cell wall biosynthesis